MALVVVLAGGGSAGHVVPALALAEAIQKADPETQIRFVGTQDGQEERLVPAAGYTLDVVPSRPVLGRSPLAMLQALLTVARGVGVAHRLLGEIGADLVIGVGGFASVPAVMAAVLRRIPTALIEANAKPGRANRLLGRFARVVCVQFEDARAYFPAGRAERLGFPVRDIPRSNGRREAGANDGLRLLIMGGSQGARAINRAVTGGLARLRTVSGLRITHQTGVLDLDEVRAAYDDAGVEAEIGAFYDDMPSRLATADLVIGRAGASTIAELCTTGVASVLVPLPLADGHQLANALELMRAGGCVVVSNDLAASKLVEEVVALLADPKARQRMADVAGTRAQPDAAARIWR
ncbi:MAG: undecaprenyldiphospho-muramoylpentapeptide beta-N-acetylglucosaminyltransferase, partial [Deltaproteobacteria bacterium]|nr:undecaprenyldiphospho-muramoylpentapeptide beta-N-acetylglucosaminyltransferase [Deltaproteobacteria bacterium]